MVIDFHTHKSETAEGILAIRSFCITEICNKFLINTPYSIGLHPWNKPNINWYEWLKCYANSPQCLFIGECGMDKLHGDIIEQQIQNLKLQIQLSETLHKPICIHCVKAFNELIELRKKTQSSQPWIVHGFRGNEQLAQQLLSHHIYVSFGTYVINPQQIKIRNTIKKIGIGNFLLETDASTIPIQNLYQSVAEIFDISVDGLTSQINKLFVSLQKN